MANILSVENLTHHWGDIRLFSNISFGLEEGQKSALIARNGTGKTTLLNIIAGKQQPESGAVTLRNGIRTACLAQEPALNGALTVMETLFDSESETVRLIRDYEQAMLLNCQTNINKLVEKMDAAGAWDYENRVKQILSKLGIANLEQPVAQLSGGQLKRVALACTLIGEPDFLILDEPTNHLDLDMIDWLEDYLKRSRATLLMVTHDRFFLDRVCNSIFELDNENLYLYQGNYSFFLEKRKERIMLKSMEIEKARNLLRKEQEWMNRMPQARATKAKYRIDAFYELKDIAQQRNDDKTIALEIETQRLGTKVIDVENISKSFHGNLLIKNFSHKFVKGEKTGIVGKNGSGKSTLLNIITGLLKPDTGYADAGETVVFGYYRQEGIRIDESKKVIDVISEIADVIDTGGGNSVNAAQFLRYFLFPNEMHHVQVSKLSGGEKKRLYLMTVLIKKPNFLILDEPTNDLDIQTLDVLEDYLVQFRGCVLTVSHDRFFLDKTVNTLFVFEEGGIIKNYPGNYSQYLSTQKQENTGENTSTPKPVRQKEKQINNKPRKLTFKEKQELEQLETQIDALGNEKNCLEAKLSSGTLTPDQLTQTSTRLGDVLNEIDSCENRWIELSDI